MDPKLKRVRTSDSGEQMNIRDINDSSWDVLVDENEVTPEGNDVEVNTQEIIEDIRIEALKRAIDIAKIMSDVTPEDIITLAEKLVSFIKDTEI